MQIYLWRHGRAEKNPPSGKDEDRTLSPEGRNDVIEVADRLFAGGSKPEKIFTSPLARARETAEMIQGFIACPKGLEVLPELKSGAPLEPLMAAALKEALSLNAFILVGHMPDLGFLAQRLVGESDPRASLKTGAVLKIELARLEEPFGGKIHLALDPPASG